MNGIDPFPRMKKTLFRVASALVDSNVGILAERVENFKDIWIVYRSGRSRAYPGDDPMQAG